MIFHWKNPMPTEGKHSHIYSPPEDDTGHAAVAVNEYGLSTFKLYGPSQRN